MFLYKTEIALAEFDLGGVLYHANYFRLYERAREAFLAEHSTPYSQLVRNGFHLAVAESHQQFHSPIFYGDDISLDLHVTKLRQTTVTFSYEISVGQNLVHSAWTYHALVAKRDSGFKPSKFPAPLRAALLTLKGE